MLNKIIKNNAGVTLLELTVAVAIFSFAVLSATQIFKMVLEGQRSAIAAQSTQESMRYALEVMSKEIRMAKVIQNINSQMLLLKQVLRNWEKCLAAVIGLNVLLR
ncbi:prepilin-type N-terminal cleavage/methylation domain-containing protein, partial [Candidatus Parcubacteria bacterium]|nr:prepilin-type N-terminal cleavage/methylation domain-containing protein [Candidatus Parcubacteria bacterium]